MSDPKRVRVRPGIRRFAIAALIILLPLAVHSLWDYIELRRLVREIESIKANGEPVSEPQDYSYKPPDPSGTPTASGYYLAGAMLALEGEGAGLVGSVDEWFAGQAHDPAALQSVIEPLQRYVEGTREAASLADKAARLPFAGFFPGTEFNYRASGVAHLWTVLNARTIVLSASGNGDAAGESVLSSLKLRAALRDGRWLLFRQDRQIASMLSLSRPSAAMLSRLYESLSAEDSPELPLQSLLRARARFVGMTWRRYYGTDPGAPRQYTLPMRSVTETLWRPWFTHGVVETLRTWAELVRAAKIPWPEKADAVARVRGQYPSERGTSTRSFGWVGGRRIALDASAAVTDTSSLIVDRGSLVAIAVERFERDRGKRPDSLSELVPQYLAAIPSDPYTGGPLLYRRAADSYTIYSVGPNKKDDGGDLTSEFQAALARGWGKRIRGTDVGVTVLVRP